MSGMIEMNQAALEAIENKAFADGHMQGRQEEEKRNEPVFAQLKRLMEILDAEDGGLVEAAQRLFEKVSTYQEASRVMQRTIETQRDIIATLRNHVTTFEDRLVTANVYHDKEHAESMIRIATLEARIQELQEELAEAKP